MNDPQQLVMDVGVSISQILDALHSESIETLDLGVTLNLNGLICAFEKKVFC